MARGPGCLIEALQVPTVIRQWEPGGLGTRPWTDKEVLDAMELFPRTTAGPLQFWIWFTD